MGLGGQDIGEAAVDEPFVDAVEFIAFAARVAEDAEEDVEGIHDDAACADALDVSAHDGEQAMDIEVAGDDLLPEEAGLNDGDLAGLFEGGEVPAHGERVFADGLGPFFEGDEHAGLAGHGTGAEELMPRTVLPEPGPPLARVVRPRGRPPSRTSSRPEIWVGTLGIGRPLPPSVCSFLGIRLGIRGPRTFSGLRHASRPQ